MSLKTALDQILKGTGLTCKIKENHIIISLPDNKNKSDDNSKQTPTQTVRGILVDTKTNTPLEYAFVSLLEEPSLSAFTDSMGRFQIRHVPIGRYNVQTSFMG